MPSKPIRDAVRAAWPTLMPDVRYIDTINRTMPYNPPMPLPPVWGTLAWATRDRRHLTMGLNPWVEETGVCTIVIVAKSGHGDDPAVSVATNVMRAWEFWESPSKDIWFSGVGAPRHLMPEAQGDWFLLGVDCEYRAQERLP